MNEVVDHNQPARNHLGRYCDARGWRESQTCSLLALHLQLLHLDAMGLEHITLVLDHPFGSDEDVFERVSLAVCDPYRIFFGEELKEYVLAVMLRQCKVDGVVAVGPEPDVR